jgi:putative endonuclease
VRSFAALRMTIECVILRSVATKNLTQILRYTQDDRKKRSDDKGKGSGGDRRAKTMKQYYIYIMASRDRTLYTGVTDDLIKRVFEHKNKLIEGFTKKYNVTNLVYYEAVNDVQAAIQREKQVKGWLRKRKIALIETMNPEWKDLSDEWYKT